jgi:predicted O-linked N-acetylglucosamine transferase (SPINDLY family)
MLRRCDVMSENWFKRGLRYQKSGDLEAAIDAYGHALKSTPGNYQALANRGIAFKLLGRIGEAVISCRKSVEINPRYANGWNNLGIALMSAERADEAIVAYRKAVDLEPKFYQSWSNLGIVLADQGILEEAIACFRKSLSLEPEYTEALIQFIFRSQSICNWDDLDAPLRCLVGQIRNGTGQINPFSLLSICSDPEELLLCSRKFSERIEEAVRNLSPPKFSIPRTDRIGQERLRIGYLSNDFHQHATAYLSAQLFESHDRSRYEVHAYSYGPDDGSPLRRRLQGGFEHFHEVRHESLIDTAKRIYQNGIDVLVDLKGYTRGARTEIMAMRPAQVQVNFLGYPGSMGAGFIDYIIADRFVVPTTEEGSYSEAIVFMPVAYQVNDALREIGNMYPTRSSLGLPERGIVFCCFNQAVKITPDVFAVWMRLLKNVPESVLWLLAFNLYTEKSLHIRAASYGIDPRRLIFAPKIAYSKHLARYKHADLFLDTFPCNAHTTASDALWGGCPVLTCTGRTFASRVAGSLLTALKMDELICETLEAYEAVALNLAQNPEKLDNYKQQLILNRASAPLFDGLRFTRNLENAYEQMWQRLRAGKAPVNIDLKLDA